MVENTQAVGPPQLSRPKPLGHADLNVHWVGAGHLERGDKLRTADGSSGIVLAVVNVVQPRVMFNLEIAGNHDFFVGSGGWLVHNCSEEELLEQAKILRNKFAKITKYPANKRPAAVIGAYDPETGRVVAACSSKLRGQCAEDVAVEMLGIPKEKVKFTTAIRPHKGQDVPVCKRCQTKYDDSQFPPETNYEGR